jgi:hypothetical protein
MLNRKDEYYRNYFFNKKQAEAIELVAKIEQLSKKDACELLMGRGLSSYMGSKITEYTRNKLAAQEQGIEVDRDRFFQKIHAPPPGFAPVSPGGVITTDCDHSQNWDGRTDQSFKRPVEIG